MKIGYFTSKFPYSHYFKEYSFGGATVAAYHLAIELAKKNCNIDVFTTSRDSNESVEKEKNINIYRYGTNFRVLTSNISVGIFIKPLIHDIDIVHTHFDIPPGPLAGLICAKRKNIPLIVTYHGDWIESYGGFIRRTGVSLHNKYIVDKILSYANIIISPSEHYIEQSIFLRNYKSKIVVIPWGINLNNFDIPYSKEESRKKLGIPFDKNILLFVGFLSPYKGPDILLKSMLKILGNIPNTELIFVGRGTMYDELVILSNKLNIENNVKFVGFVDDYEKILYYKAADIFVLPSTMSTESFGIVNLEAMACGLPIIASHIGGIPDIVKDNENGILVPSRNIDTLADAIIYILGNKNIGDKMGKKGKLMVKDYSWDIVAERVKKEYIKLLA